MVPRFSLLPSAVATAGAAFAILPLLAGAAPPATPAELYLRACSACHGERGDGRSRATMALKTPPRDFTTPEARANLSREYMIAIVRDGRPHTAMVGRSERLTQDEIEGVVDYIRATFMRGPAAAPAAGR